MTKWCHRISVFSLYPHNRIYTRRKKIKDILIIINVLESRTLVRKQLLHSCEELAREETTLLENRWFCALANLNYSSPLGRLSKAAENSFVARDSRLFPPRGNFPGMREEGKGGRRRRKRKRESDALRKDIRRRRRRHCE